MMIKKRGIREEYRNWVKGLKINKEIKETFVRFKRKFSSKVGKCFSFNEIKDK